MQESRRGRPSKPDGERLQPVSTNLRPETYDAIWHAAREQRVPVAEYLRDMIERQVVGTGRN